MEASAIITIAITVFILIAIYKGFKIVPQAETMVIERLGKFNRVLNSGINIIWPFIESPRLVGWKYMSTDVKGNNVVIVKDTAVIDLREQVYDFPRQNVITKDNVNITINALLYFQISDPMRSVYEINNLPTAIEKLTQTTLRNVLGELDLDESLTSRDTINSKLRTILDEATDKWGVKINRVELQDIDPPEDIKDQMEKQMRAERDRRAAVLVAEGSKKAAILESEGVRDAEINKAEGEKQAAILKAEGEAQARIRVAQAEAKAVDVVIEAVKDRSDPISYLVAIRYIDTLQEMVSGENNKTIYLPYEATSVLSSLGGIKDLFKSIDTNDTK